MRSIICDLLFLPTFQICAVFIFLHSPWPKTNPVYNRLFSIWFYSLPFLFWSSLRLFVAQHVQHLCNTMFSGTLIFPVALHHAVLYLLSKALLGLGTSCASWQRERKWKENVVVPLPTAIQQIKTEKRAMCAFTDGVLQHPVLNAVSRSALTNRTVLKPWCRDGDMNMKWSEEGRGFRTGCRPNPNQYNLDEHHSSVSLAYLTTSTRLQFSCFFRFCPNLSPAMETMGTVHC